MLQSVAAEAEAGSNSIRWWVSLRRGDSPGFNVAAKPEAAAAALDAWFREVLVAGSVDANDAGGCQTQEVGDGFGVEEVVWVDQFGHVRRVVDSTQLLCQC